MTAPAVNGLHHVTAIAGDPQANLDFHAGAFGQRLVKRTVNFDAPDVHHLYYGDATGAPGTVLTFFPFPQVRPGRPGAGQATELHYAVPPGALAFWKARLPAHGGALLGEETRFGAPRARFADPDGLRLTLVERDDPRAPWSAPGIPPAAATRGFAGVTLALRDGAAERRVLTEVFGYEETASEALGEGRLLRLDRPGAPAGAVELHLDPALPAGAEGAGSIHHIAFRAADRAEQDATRMALLDLGLEVTPPIDRQYFHAVYARLPGVLFEVATDGPGFLTDEPEESLGRALKLPPRYEAHRARIEAALPPLRA